jgi:hypothetical protein
MQFQGDAILASFNAPSDNDDHAASALDAALAIVRETRTRTFGDGQELEVRIGVNTGTVLAAAVGSAERADFTNHGDAVNLTARRDKVSGQNRAGSSLSNSVMTPRRSAVGASLIWGTTVPKLCYAPSRTRSLRPQHSGQKTTVQHANRRSRRWMDSPTRADSRR